MRRQLRETKQDARASEWFTSKEETIKNGGGMK
jgi:hypothetical protein